MSIVLGYAASDADPVNARWLQHATRSFASASPDGQQVWLGTRAGLGHAALHVSIDDPSPQPLSLDNTVWLSADVRLDDRAELIRALASAGRRVPERADDARLLLESYLVWGEQCVEHLAGDFAFALWDGRHQRLFCARDQMGVVPVYYAVSIGELLVSNAIDALLLHDAVSDALDDETVGDFLIAGHTLNPARTMFAGIRQVPPAHALTWQGGQAIVRRYWSVPEWNGFAHFSRPEEYAEHFADVLRAAVADRTRTAHVGVQLSGGLDSTSIAALAREVSASSVTPFGMHAYTGSVSSIMADRETEYAALVASRLGIPHASIDISAYPDIDPLATPELVTPEPTSFRRTAFERDFVQQPAAHGRVVLTGLGGDVLLQVEPSFWMDWLASGQVWRAASAYFSHIRTFRRLPVPGFRSGVRRIALRYVDGGVPMADWIGPAFASQSELGARYRAIHQAVKRQDDAPGLATYPFWSALLANGHPGFTRAPVRFRHPFFDLRLIHLALALPPRPWLMDKRILRDAMRMRLPDVVTRRGKAPLPMPAARALRTVRGAHEHLAELIDAAPGLDKFVVRARLRETVVTGLQDRRLQRMHSQAIGLAYWLHHRQHSPRVSAPIASSHSPPGGSELFAVC